MFKPALHQPKERRRAMQTDVAGYGRHSAVHSAGGNHPTPRPGEKPWPTLADKMPAALTAWAKRTAIIALLILAACAGPVQHLEPGLSADVQAGRMSATEAIGKQRAINDERIFKAAEDASGYIACINGPGMDIYYAGPANPTGEQIATWSTDKAMEICKPKFGAFATALRTAAKGVYYESELTDTAIHDAIRQELVKRLRVMFGT